MYWLVVGFLLVLVGFGFRLLTRSARRDLSATLTHSPHDAGSIFLSFAFPVFGALLIIAGLIDILA